MATVCDGDEISSALSSDAEGIGLLRCDTLFTEASSKVLEELLFDTYKKALDSFKGKAVVAVTYSWGRDRLAQYSRDRCVPWMGARGIRFCLAERELFKCQLRSILRSARSDALSVALPAVVSPEEIRRARAVMIETANELKNEGVFFGDKLRLGVIIDTPASAICGELLAPEVDFFIADSDLLSVFTLAADNRDPAVSDIIKKNPEPVLRLIENATRAIHSSGKGKRIGVSGDLAADTSFTERLISIGVDFLSVPPPEILRIRERVRECP
jgi:phosphotransferase system enzyme I (PtsI)